MHAPAPRVIRFPGDLTPPEWQASDDLQAMFHWLAGRKGGDHGLWEFTIACPQALAAGECGSLEPS
jgi:hypothetical protein